MTALVFMDTETDGLRPDRRFWEVAAVAHDPDAGGPMQHPFHRFVRLADLDMANAEPYGLKVGRFHDRHPEITGHSVMDAHGNGAVESEEDILRQLEALTRGAHIVGAVPNFDTEVLGNRMRARNVLPAWHYHLIDVETLVVGYLAGLRATTSPDLKMPDLPWSSDDLSRLIGVNPPGGGQRHTAVGDVYWSMSMFGKVMGQRYWA